MKPIVNFAQLDCKGTGGLTLLMFPTGETAKREVWPEGYKKGTPVMQEYSVINGGTPSIRNQKIQRELEVDFLKRLDSLLKELRTEYEEKFEEDDGKETEWCSEADMLDYPGGNCDRLYYT